jgi:hypothetical protein
MNDLWPSAALQLSEAAARRKRELSFLLPAMQQLLRESKIAHTPLGDSLSSWLSSMSKETEAPSPLKCGWLWKQSRSGLSRKKRWVVLDGAALMYYSSSPDGLQDAPLKGVLRLHHGVRIKTTPRGFDVEALTYRPTGSTDAALPTAPLPGAHHHARSYSAPTVASSVTQSVETVLNPLHATKQRYVWHCADEVERDSWIAALQAASIVGAREVTALRWSCTFAAAKTCAVFWQHLLEFQAQGSPVMVLADWVRVHMATGGRSSSLCDDSAAATRPKRGLFGRRSEGTASSPALSHATSFQVGVSRLASGGTSIHQHLLLVSSPKNAQASRALQSAHRRSTAAAEAAKKAVQELRGALSPSDASAVLEVSGDSGSYFDYSKQSIPSDASAPSDSQPSSPTGSAASRDVLRLQRLQLEAASASAMREQTSTSISAYETSALRRRVGYAPGDHVDVEQASRDFGRDVVVIDGRRMAQCTLHDLVAELASRVVASVDAVCGNRPTWRASFPELPSRLVDFARIVLEASSRTVIGGDALDAIEFVFRHPDRFRLKPLSDVGSPVVIAVGIAGVAIPDRYLGPSAQEASPPSDAAFCEIVSDVSAGNFDAASPVCADGSSVAGFDCESSDEGEATGPSVGEICSEQHGTAAGTPTSPSVFGAAGTPKPARAATGPRRSSVRPKHLVITPPLLSNSSLLISASPASSSRAASTSTHQEAVAAALTASTTDIHSAAALDNKTLTASSPASSAQTVVDVARGGAGWSPAQALSSIEVRVACPVEYRVIDSVLEEAESDTEVNLGCPAPGHVATLRGDFTRTFKWGTAPASGSVTLSVSWVRSAK